MLKVQPYLQLKQGSKLTVAPVWAPQTFRNDLAEKVLEIWLWKENSNDHFLDYRLCFPPGW